jgi:hypothetical protein
VLLGVRALLAGSVSGEAAAGPVLVGKLFEAVVPQRGVGIELHLDRVAEVVCLYRPLSR